MKKVVGLILALILLLSLSILAAAEEAVPDMFANLVERLKANEPRRLVFTEGTDARILEAAARLKQEGIITPVLIGDPEAVKAAAADGGFDIE